MATSKSRFGLVLNGCLLYTSCRGSAHCCALLQDGNDGKHQPVQHLDSRCLRSADCSFRYLPYLHHQRSRCAGLALWKGKKSKKVKNIEIMLFLKLFLDVYKRQINFIQNFFVILGHIIIILYICIRLRKRYVMLSLYLSAKINKN